MWLLDVKWSIFIEYYHRIAKASMIYELTDGPAIQPAGNPPNSDGYGDDHGTVLESTVRVYWRPGPPNWHRFGSDPYPDPKWQSRPVANTTHIANVHKLTESEITELTSSTVNETALAILMREGSWEITIVSSQRKIRFDIQVDPYWQKWQTKCSKLAAKYFETSEFHQDTWNCYGVALS